MHHAGGAIVPLDMEPVIVDGNLAVSMSWRLIMASKKAVRRRIRTSLEGVRGCRSASKTRQGPPRWFAVVKRDSGRSCYHCRRAFDDDLCQYRTSVEVQRVSEDLVSLSHLYLMRRLAGMVGQSLALCTLDCRMASILLVFKGSSSMFVRCF